MRVYFIVVNNRYIEIKVITDGTKQLIDLLANDTPLQLPTFRHEVMSSSQSQQVGQTPTRSHQGSDEGGLASSTTTPTADETKTVTVTPLLPPPPPPSVPAANSTKQKKRNGKTQIHHDIRTLLFLALFARPWPPDISSSYSRLME